MFTILHHDFTVIYCMYYSITQHLLRSLDNPPETAPLTLTSMLTQFSNSYPKFG